MDAAFLLSSIVLIKIDLEVFHTARSALLGTRQILKGLDALLRAQVDDEEMRSRGTTLRLPIGRFLQVEDLIA